MLIEGPIKEFLRRKTLTITTFFPFLKTKVIEEKWNGGEQYELKNEETIPMTSLSRSRYELIR